MKKFNSLPPDPLMHLRVDSQNPAHTHVTVWIGDVAGQRARAGVLTFRNRDLHSLARALWLHREIELSLSETMQTAASAGYCWKDPDCLEQQRQFGCCDHERAIIFGDHTTSQELAVQIEQAKQAATPSPDDVVDLMGRLEETLGAARVTDIQVGADGTVEIDGRSVLDVQTCRVCGCTEDRACIGGCSWHEPGLCTSCTLTVPVVTTDEVKEPHLRGRRGVLLLNHPYTDHRSSFMVKLDVGEGLLQCGSYEFRLLDTRQLPENKEARRIAEEWNDALPGPPNVDPGHWANQQPPDAHLEADFEDRISGTED